MMHSSDNEYCSAARLTRRLIPSATCSSDDPASPVEADSSNWFSEAFPPISFQEVNKHEYSLHIGKFQKESTETEKDIRHQAIFKELDEILDTEHGNSTAGSSPCETEEASLDSSESFQQKHSIVGKSPVDHAMPSESSSETRQHKHRIVGKSPVDGRELPEDFVPGPWSVVIGRDKKSLDAPGNKRLRVIMERHMKEYAKCGSNKEAKSDIISSIESTIQHGHGAKSRGAFVRQVNGKWYEVKSGFIREKISRLLRESLHTQYKSSSRQKRLRRRSLLLSHPNEVKS